MNNDVVIIQLDRPRMMKFGHTALKTLVELTGKSIEELDNNFDVTNFEFLEKLAYCGLLYDAKEHNETLVPDQISSLLDAAPSFAHVLQKVVAAWHVAFGVKAADAEGNQQPAAKPENENNSTGKKA